MSFNGTVKVTYTKNGVDYMMSNEGENAIIDPVIAHAREHLRAQHSELDISGLSYQLANPDFIKYIMSDNQQEQIQIPPLKIDLSGARYEATFGPLEFPNQIGGRRRHKLRSRRAKKTAKRKHNLKRKTHRRKHKLHRK